MPEWLQMLMVAGGTIATLVLPFTPLLWSEFRMARDLSHSRTIFMGVLPGQRWDIEGIGRVKVVDVAAGYYRTSNRQVHACVSGPSGRIWLCAEQWERLATPYYGEL